MQVLYKTLYITLTYIERSVAPKERVHPLHTEKERVCIKIQTLSYLGESINGTSGSISFYSHTVNRLYKEKIIKLCLKNS